MFVTSERIADDLEVRVFHDDRRSGSGVGWSWRAVSSAAVAVVLALVPLTACSSDSESSTSPDSTSPAASGETGGAPDQSVETATFLYPLVEGATLEYQGKHFSAVTSRPRSR